MDFLLDLVVSCIAAAAPHTTIYVPPGGDIQLAIDSCPDGGTVILMEGTHTLFDELEIRNRSVLLTGVRPDPNAEPVSVVRRLGTGRLASFEGNAPVLGAPNRLVDLVFLNGIAIDGACFDLRDGGLELESCVLRNHRSSGGHGGAIHATNATLTLRDCKLEGNVARITFDSENFDPRGGAIHATDSTVDVDACRFEGNTAEIGGGAIHLESCDWSVRRSHFFENQAFRDWDSPALTPGGGIAAIDSDGRCEETTFIGNIGEGAGIRAVGGTLEVRESILQENGALTAGKCSFCAGGRGGGIFAVDLSSLHVDGCLFSRNESGSGTGLELANCIGTIEDCAFTENRGPGCNYAGTRGRGVAAQGSSLTIRGCVFTDLTANAGAGVFAIGGGSLGIHDCAFANTRAFDCPEAGYTGRGGGVYAEVDDLYVSDSSFFGTCADISGDAVWTTADAIIAGSSGCGSCSEPIGGDWTDGGRNDFDGDCPPSCPEDLTGDGQVDRMDLMVVLATVAPGGAVCSDWYPCPTDLDGDGLITGSDLARVLVAWGNCQ